MRSSNFSYSASGFGALRIAAWTSLGIVKELLFSTGRHSGELQRFEWRSP
jgi:hypothetical protein